jgi:hypothetical protein
MSASFHMAQRTGVILSGDYSGEDGVTRVDVPSGKYGITNTGLVWENGYVFNEYWTYSDDYTKGKEPGARKLQSLKQTTVGWRSDFAAAVTEARKYVSTEKNRSGFTGPGSSTAKDDSSSKGGLTMPPATYNDGSYTYDVKSSTEAFVPETGVKFTPDSERWDKFVSDLNTAYANKTLKKGKAPAKTSSSSSYTPPPAVAPATLAPVETPFYKAKWFLPAVAGGTVLLVLAIALWPKKKKDSAPVVYLPAPAPVPVPAPVAPTLPAPQVI